MSSILIFIYQNLPKNTQAETISNFSFTNFLVFSNIIVSVLVAWVIRDRIEKKTKEYEVDAHIKKIKAEKTILFCINLYHVFSKICLKNPVINGITNAEIEDLNSKIHCEELLFIENEDLNNIKDFRDYIIQVMVDPTKKDIFREKSYFYLIKKIINK